MTEPTKAAVLMELGRDREAVEAATRESLNRPEGGLMDGVAQLDQIIPELRRLADGIGSDPDRLALPTPCANFTVAGVLEHMIGGATMFAPAFRGTAGVAAPAGGSVHERFHRAMADLLDAVHTPGAQERTIASPFGEVPGSVFARYVAFDGLVHAWDLAVATGQDFAPDDAVVAEVDGFIRGLLQPEMRDGDTFAVETSPPADASPLERVVAFSGRTVVRP